MQNMGRTENLEGKIEDEVKELKPVIYVSSGGEDDKEENEDLSLKIVQKSKLMRAAKLAENENQDIDFVQENAYPSYSGVRGVCHGGGLIANGDRRVVEDGLSSSQGAGAVTKKKRRKKNKVHNGKTGEQYDDCSQEKDKAGTLEKVENSKAALVEIDENVDSTSVQTSDNMVLRKLLRGRRYFDPPDSGWSSCYYCGEDGHMAVNCPSFQKKKKPCFLCGSFEHGYKQCSKERICSICKTPGHRPKKCPEKHKGGPLTSKVCLKCGDSGHDMFSCENSYAVDDLKEIQCYICKSFGHLCCVNIFNNSPREVSCYKCGELGHAGMECSSLCEEAITKASPNTSCYKCGEVGHFARECTCSVKTNLCNQAATAASLKTCYRCGEGGHFARECMSSVKAGKGNDEFSTPPLKPHREKKGGASVFKSAPELGKHCRRKTNSEERSYMTPQKPKERGGWIMDDPGDVSQSRRRKNRWASPSPHYVAHSDFNFMPDGLTSGSQSSERVHNVYSNMSNFQSGKRMRVNMEVQHSNEWQHRDVQHSYEWLHRDVQHSNEWRHRDVQHSNEWRHGSNLDFQYSRFNNSFNGGYRGNFGGW